MRDLHRESLSHDPIHGYIPFTADRGLEPGEVAERTVIDHPWVQRLRQIHQLQTAWWVYPTAEHTRFQHVLGVMHLGSRAVAALYDSLKQVCPDVPSRGYVESLVRMAGLLHDVGHGPFGHFFDDQYLADYGLNHESLGSAIIRGPLAELIRGIRRNPNGRLEPHETLDPVQIAVLIKRPTHAHDAARRDGERAVNPPRWLQLLQSLFSGIYTIDNMDFVLRDAYMSGYSGRAFDLDRLLNYSFFTAEGLAIHQRAVDALVRFVGVRAELFRSVYFHRTVRAIDLSLKDLFRESKQFLFPGNPLENLDAYLRFTDWSLLVDVASWKDSPDERKRALGVAWQRFLRREIPWKMVCQRNLVFAASDSERGSLFADAELLERALRKELPASVRDAPLRIDIARHVHRPDTRGPTAGLNYLYDPTAQRARPLSTDSLYRQLPIAHRICRIYAESLDDTDALCAALDRLLGPGGSDDLTNM
ncbi:MAG: metal-dependent phosphohydrolase [Planctomycetota bacterium]|nr:MAG: metal-dependent phosphohydrolase [Planctomycetota bacterium]